MPCRTMHARAPFRPGQARKRSRNRDFLPKCRNLSAGLIEADLREKITVRWTQGRTEAKGDPPAYAGEAFTVLDPSVVFTFRRGVRGA